MVARVVVYSDKLSWGHRWGHATRIRGTCGTTDPRNHAVLAKPCRVEWAVKDSNLRPWD
jgi:hypothetical protein